MAKTSKLARNAQRRELVARYAEAARDSRRSSRIRTRHRKLARKRTRSFASCRVIQLGRTHPQSVQHVGSSPRVHPAVRTQPHCAPRHGPQRPDPRCAQGELVSRSPSFTSYRSGQPDTIGALYKHEPERPDCRHADAHPQCVCSPSTAASTCRFRTIKIEIARILKENHFITDYRTVETEDGKPVLRVILKYAHGGQSVIREAQAHVHARSAPLCRRRRRSRGYATAWACAF